MKTIATLLLLFILPCSVFAQLQKGQWMVGGIADFSHGSSDDHYPLLDHKSKVTSYRAMPGAGYFFMNGFCGGLRFSITSSKSAEDNVGSTVVVNYISSYDTKLSGLGLSPFLRYYFLPGFAKLNVFVDGSFTYATENLKTNFYQETTQQGAPPGPPSIMQLNTKNKTKGNYYSLAAGPALFIGKNISLELSVGYTIGETKETHERKSTIAFGTGFQVHLGK